MREFLPRDFRPAPEPAIVSQLGAWLTALGLVRNAGDQSAGTSAWIEPPAIGLTIFGIELLQHLGSRA